MTNAIKISKQKQRTNKEGAEIGALVIIKHNHTLLTIKQNNNNCFPLLQITENGQPLVYKYK